MGESLLEVEFMRWADNLGKELLPAWTTMMPRVPCPSDTMVLPDGTRLIVQTVLFELSEDKRGVERIVAVVESQTEVHERLNRFRGFVQGDDPGPKDMG